MDAVIAKAFDRYHYGEKLLFVYYVWGSLYETKYWLNRTLERELLSKKQVKNYSSDLTRLARQLNSSLSTMRNLRTEYKIGKNRIGETKTDYASKLIEEDSRLFAEQDKEFINQIHEYSSEYLITSYQSLISNHQTKEQAWTGINSSKHFRRPSCMT